MDIIKKALAASALTLALASPAAAGTEPVLGFSTADTPYGAFSCKQRAEAKLFSIGATGIAKSSGGQVLWAKYGGSFTIGVWCRGSEAVIIVAGDSNTTDIADEIRSAF